MPIEKLISDLVIISEDKDEDVNEVKEYSEPATFTHLTKKKKFRCENIYVYLVLR